MHWSNYYLNANLLISKSNNQFSLIFVGFFSGVSDMKDAIVCIQNWINLGNPFFFSLFIFRLGVEKVWKFIWFIHESKGCCLQFAPSTNLFEDLHRTNLSIRKISDQTCMNTDPKTKLSSWRWQKAEATLHLSINNATYLLSLFSPYDLWHYQWYVFPFSFLFGIHLSELYPLSIWLCSRFCFGSAHKSSKYVFKLYEPSWCMCCV